MKKIITVFGLGILLFSCSPAITAMQPDAQTPPTVSSAGSEEPVATDLDAGKSLYENKCNKCHDLYATTDFSAEEWKPILKRMQIKAKIDDSQTASIYNYIVSGMTE